MAGPLIGVTTSLAPATEKQPERAVMNAPYIRAVQQAGGVPILLSPYHDAASLETLLPMLGGLLLTGGGDVSPALYGEPIAGTIEASISDARDAFEIDALERAMALETPLLFICRGMQIANVGLGGSLIQDIPAAIPGAIQHSQNERRDEATHQVAITAGTKLAALLGTDVAVNTMHHQSVKAPGRGVEIVACAPDGVVEGIELPAYPSFAIGVQWHPEHLAAWQPEAQKLFAAFIAAARAR